jgi:hypothetical protein
MFKSPRVMAVVALPSTLKKPDLMPLMLKHISISTWIA